MLKSKLKKFALMPFLMLGFFLILFLNPNLSRAESTGSFSSDYSKISQGSYTYYRVGSSGLGGGLSLNRELLYTQNPTKVFFALSKDEWFSTKPGVCQTISPEDSKRKFISIDKNAYDSAVREKKSVSGEIHAYYHHNLINQRPCGWDLKDIGDGTIKINPAAISVTYNFSFSVSNPNTFGGVAINQTSPKTDNFGYTTTNLDNLSQERAVYVNSDKTLAILIGINKFPVTVMPVQAELYEYTGGKLGSKIIDTEISGGGGVVAVKHVTGFVLWGGSKLANYEGDVFSVVLIKKGSGSKKNFDVNPKTAMYDAGDLEAGEYTVTVDKQVDGKFLVFLERLFGDVTVTTVHGETTFTIKSDGKLTGSTDIDIGTTQEKKESLVDDALNNLLLGVMTDILDAFSDKIEETMDGVAEVIEGGDEINNLNGLKQVWGDIRNLSLSLLTFGLLLIAFANILQIDIERYGLNRMIPKIVIGIVLTIFSFEICRFILEMSTAFSHGLTAIVGSKQSVIDLTGNLQGIISSLNTGTFAQLIFILLLCLALALIALWLMIILFVRKVVILFLVAIVPLAFMMQIMPFTEKLYKMWWSKFWQWVFMGPVIMFFLYLGSKFLVVGYFPTKAAPPGSEVGNLFVNYFVQPDAWSFLVLTAVCWGIAAYVPLMMGKEVYGKLSKPAKGLFNKLPPVRKTKAMLSARSAEIDKRYKNAANTSRQRLMFDENGNVRGGLRGMAYRNLAGVTPDQLPQAYQSMIEETAKNHAGDLDTLKREAVTGGIVGDAAIWRMASDGTLPTPDITKDPATDAGEARARQIATRVEALSGRLPGLRGKVQKENKDYAAGVTAVNPNSSFAGAAASGIRGAEDVSKLKPAQWQLASQDRDLLRELISSQGALGKLFREGGAKSKTAAAQAIAAHEDLRRSLPLELRNQINTTLGRPLEQMENMTDQEHRNYGPPPPGHQFGDESG